MADDGSGRSDGRQARWKRHNEERRRQILDAAIAVLEENEPGAELHVQDIAVRAGLSRTVVYRHFADRDDLDRALQEAILDGLWSQLLPAVTLTGTVPDIIRRIVRVYVDWAVAHPALHHAADHDADDGGPLQQGMEQIATLIAEVIGAVAMSLEVDPTADEIAALDPLVFGLVGAVFGAVRRWLTRADRQLTADALVDLTSRSVWFVIDGHARSMGVVIDPDLPIEQLIASDSLQPTT